MIHCTHFYLQIYRKINIRVVLSALEIWTDKDHVPFVKQAGEDLRNFENHHSSNLAGVKYDSIHLLRQEIACPKCSDSGKRRELGKASEKKNVGRLGRGGRGCPSIFPPFFACHSPRCCRILRAFPHYLNSWSMQATHYLNSRNRLGKKQKLYAPRQYYHY